MVNVLRSVSHINLNSQLNGTMKYQDPLLRRLTGQSKKSDSKYRKIQSELGSPFATKLLNAYRDKYCVKIGPLFYSVVDYEFNKRLEYFTFKLVINPFMRGM